MDAVPSDRPIRITGQRFSTNRHNTTGLQRAEVTGAAECIATGNVNTTDGDRAQRGIGTKSSAKAVGTG